MSSGCVSVSVLPGSVIAGRYAVERALGRGGMGSVYAVVDTSTGQRLALKYLHKRRMQTEAPAAALFQREYHTLAHLRHPRVIQVYDYGVAEGRPYYTMELLDGADLRELAPLPWPRACGILRDVASSLALLHSRRLLHRDLSARNVRCTRDGQGKLIDFGTMTPMGVAKDVAGTAPYMAPEAVHGQELDARTDLYSFGALMYWTLTGHDAYPARDVRELRRLWQRPFAAPSTLSPGIPDSLDSLVLSLLSLDMHARPGSAAEVIERITAIADLEPMEQLDVARSYLSTPTLIGHGDTLARFHKRLVRAARGRGSALLIEGESGLGRSRLLQAFVLEAKLCGVLVLSADADDAARGEMGVAQRLLDSIAESAPDVALDTFAPYADVLGPLMPQLAARLPEPVVPPDLGRQERQARVSTAMRDWMLRVSQRRPLMVVVDDVEQADELSQVFLALLAGDALMHRLVVSVTANSDVLPNLQALRSFASTAARVELRPMEFEHTLELLRSVFGDVPNLRAVAGWAHTLAQGNPRTLMELSQHVVDQRIARYERGRWELPESITQRRLPANVTQALSQLVAGLSSGARELGEALALTADRGQLELAEVVRLYEGRSIRETYRAVDELVATQVVASTGSLYQIRHQGLVRALLKNLDDERRRDLHKRLAGVYAQRIGSEGPGASEAVLLSAYHHVCADDVAAAIDLLAKTRFDLSQPFARSRAALDTLEACLRGADELRLPEGRIFSLRKVLVTLAAEGDADLVEHAAPLVNQLKRASGLTYLEKFADEPDTERRIRRCIARARELYEARPEAERGLPPERALVELAWLLLALTSGYSVRHDIEALADLSVVLRPARSLSPLLDLLQEIIEQSADALSGQALVRRRVELLRRLEQPPEGLEPSLQQRLCNVTRYWLAMEEACCGQESALDLAAELDAAALYSGIAWQVRTVYHLFRGCEREAEEARQRRERLALEGRLGEATQSLGALYELDGYYRCGDIIGLRHMLSFVEEIASRHPGWRRQEQRARGRYLLLRGEAWSALSRFERADDPLGQADALIALGKGRAALQILDGRYPPEVRATLHPIVRWGAEASYAKALLQSGELALAADYLERVIAQAEAEGLDGLLRFSLHEARARVAIGMDDAPAFEPQMRRLSRMADIRATALRSRYEQITGEAKRALFWLPPETPSSSESVSSVSASDIATRLDSIATPLDRMNHALRLLSRQAGASLAYLFGLRGERLELCASVGEHPPPEGLTDMLSFYLSAELEAAELDPRTSTGTFDVSSDDMVAFINDGHRVYYPVLMTCLRERRRVIGGVAVLAIPFQREPDLPADVVAQVSEALLEAGDLEAAKAAD